ncbi:SMC family ATPase [Pseudalkalibacillus hwajinpoensis]|uniref:SMC family ATPase n=1 Tax=Guptibacillus hwajinpoensis TaxID=208199 RepID=UPI00325B64AC
MKPIRLTVSGLHSFREKQEIDFETLCQGGIFGIFGPTGSGKSSLLDAMTLALYGKVERATNNTQGIMNHAEDTLSVSFTFALGEKLRYQVERSYKRSGDVSIRSANSRLIEIGEEHTVLADKDRDVSQKIQEILGLTIDDFTRAVVLPQGKFAEFLSLKGTERRQMLQRLFQLEKYGDQFNRRLRARVDEKRYYLNEVTAEQTGLGEASKENLKDARESLQRTEEAAEKAKVDLDAAEKRKEEVSKNWSLQQELVQLNKKKESLSDKSEDIEMLEAEIKKALAASQLKPYLDAVEATEIEALAADSRYEETKQNLEESKKIYLSSRQKYDLLRAKQQEQEPVLIKRLNDLERGMGLEKELSRLKGQWNTRLEQRQSFETEAKETSERTEKAEQDLKVARSLQNDLNSQLIDLNVSPEERKRMSRAQGLKTEWQSITKQAEEALGEESKLLGERERLEPLINEVNKHLEKTKESYLAYFKALVSLYNTVSSNKLSLDQHIARLGARIHESYQKLEESRTHAIAIQLASELHEGDSCPVCGAKEHVKLAEGEDHTLKWQHRIQQDEQMRDMLKDQLQHAKQLHYQLEQLSDRMTEQDERLRDVQQNDSTEVKQNLSDEERITELKSLIQDARELEEKIKQTGKSLQEDQAKRSEQTYRLEQLQLQLDSQVEKRRERSKQLEEIEKTIEQELSLKIEEIDPESKKIEKMDQQANVVRERLSKSVPYIEEKEKRLNTLQEMGQKHSVRIAELTSSLSELQEQIQKMEGEYKAIAGNSTAEAGFNQVDHQLKTLRNQEKAVSEELKKADERYQQTERKAAADRSYSKDVKRRLQDAMSTYQTAENGSIFSGRNQVRKAEAPMDKRIEWEQQVEAYRKEWNQTEHALSELEKKLSGTRTTEEEWKESIQQADDARIVREEALSLYAASRHHLEDVSRRHERYMELEQKRKTASDELEKLGKLQTVFRGNSFVEFIASEQLEQVSLNASQKLGDLTSQRYAIEVDSSGGFLIRDDANGGVRRPVSTLSGGETFLTSLALALALSGQIQLRGAHPLQFFFLDEGFGTLDESLLDTVITSLEKLQNESLSVGVISHVPELRARLPRKVIVSPSEPSGRGSRIEMESL